MYYVYILKSVTFPAKNYIGYTTNIDHRLMVHNAGESLYTNKYKPWALRMCLTFQEESKAIAFEKYLKTGSGKAFIKNHF